MEYVDDKMLLARIRRSYNHISRRLRMDGKAETRLFEFEKIEKERFPAHCRISFVTGFSATIKLTGEKYYVSQTVFFGRADWSLYREESK